MRLLVLGDKGMLGQMLCRYFASKDNIKLFVISTRYTAESRFKFLDEIEILCPNVIINCIGEIPQKNGSNAEIFSSNADLPLFLSKHIASDILLIHPSTDCVFSGEIPIGNYYTVCTKPNAQSAYGISKADAERAVLARNNSVVIRTSIIGPDNRVHGAGLLNWFIRTCLASDKIEGFTNHYWNGITTLQWAKIAETFLYSFTPPCDGMLIQPSTENILSKFQLLSLFNKYFGYCCNITPINNRTYINRALKPNIASPDIEQQLVELNNFMSAY